MNETRCHAPPGGGGGVLPPPARAGRPDGRQVSALNDALPGTWGNAAARSNR